MLQDNTKWMDQAFQDLKNQEIDEFTGNKKRPKKTQFKYSNGLPGTYKTTAIIKVSDEWTKKNKGSVHCVPSKLLCSEVESRHKADCMVLNSDTIDDDESVGGCLKRVVAEGLDKALILTHHAILNTERIPLTDYTLFFDELFDPTIHIEINGDSELKATLNRLLIVPSINQKYSKIEVEDKAKVWEMIYLLRGTDDLSNNQLERLLTFVARSNHFVVYSHNAFNKSFLEGDGEKFVATAIIKPDLFHCWKEVRFSAAGFEHSLLYFLWNKIFGIEWIQDNEMMKYLREPLKRKLVVRYWIESRGWSKTFGKQMDQEQTMLDKFYADTEEYLKDNGITQVLLGKNKDDTHTLNGVEAEDLPFGSYGLNSFTHHHTFIEAGAYLKSNAYYELLEWLGLSKEAKSDDCERIYQNLYRTGIRSSESNEVWTLIIPSRNLFPKHFIERFDVVDQKKFGHLVEDNLPKVGRPKGSTKVDPSLVARRQYVLNKKSRLNAILKKQGIEFEEKKMVVTIFDAPTVDASDEAIESFPSIGDRHEFYRDEFYEYLMQESLKTVQKKFQNLSFAVIDYQDNRRGHFKVKAVYGAVFDFDATEEEGLITPDRVKTILGECSFVLYPSFSGGYKNRLVVLFKESLTPEEAGQLIEHIHLRFLEEYPECKSDNQCLSFSQSWFLPRNKAAKPHAFQAVHVTGELFDAIEFLHGTVGWGLSEKQQVRDLAIQKIVIKKPEDELFNQKILPELVDMGKGNRFNLGQRLVGLCKKICPTMNGKLIDEFRTRGMSKAQLRDMEKLQGL